MEKTLDLSMIAEKCPKNLTGADFYALCSDAMLNALKRKITMLEKGKMTIILYQIIAYINDMFDSSLSHHLYYLQISH